jgi:hypothetical protein
MNTNRNDIPDGGPDREGKLPAAGTGNASNPSPHEDLQPAGGNQLIDKRGEKYLREVASPEDYPDAEDEQEMNDTLAEENKD